MAIRRLFQMNLRERRTLLLRLVEVLEEFEYRVVWMNDLGRDEFADLPPCSV